MHLFRDEFSLKIIDIVGKYLFRGCPEICEPLGEKNIDPWSSDTKENGDGKLMAVAICWVIPQNRDERPWGEFSHLFLFSLQDERQTLTAADAKSGQAVAGVALFHGVDQFGNEDPTAA